MPERCKKLTKSGGGPVKSDLWYLLTVKCVNIRFFRCFRLILVFHEFLQPLVITSKTLSGSSTCTQLCLFQQPLFSCEHFRVKSRHLCHENSRQYQAEPSMQLHNSPWVCLFSSIFWYAVVPAEPNYNAVLYFESGIQQGFRYILGTYKYRLLLGSPNDYRAKETWQEAQNLRS
jgi:hypothetical protein